MCLYSTYTSNLNINVSQCISVAKGHDPPSLFTGGGGAVDRNPWLVRT